MRNRVKKSKPPAKRQPPGPTLEVPVGPVPPPHILEEYNKIVSGAAERILSMAEHEQKAQFEFHRLAARQYRRGQIFGLIVTLAAFATCLYALLRGFEVAATVIGGVTVVSLATVFVTGRSQKAGRSSPK